MPARPNYPDVRCLAPAVLALFAALAIAGCNAERPSDAKERWVTTNNTNVEIDWDKINDAYKQAEGPADFERRVNEIYEGEEIVSVSVSDNPDNKSQDVVGFFDRNGNGQVEDEERVFAINRTVVDDSKGQYQIHGYNSYASYRSPMWDIAGGMILGSMISNMFMPRYVPIQSYTTNQSRMSELQSQRSSYRAANPSRFSRPKASGSGRTYGDRSGSWGSSTRSSGSAPRRSFGGGRFGIKSRRRTRIRLTA